MPLSYNDYRTIDEALCLAVAYLREDGRSNLQTIREFERLAERVGRYVGRYNAAQSARRERLALREED